ncbi:MAG TPA: MFS transporter, partial [Actinomycetes bacterium]|nr:MFS transporter [Actinomycetes bacterium]
ERSGPRLVRPTHALALLGAIAFCGLLCEGAAYDWSAVYLRDSLGSSEGLAVSGYVGFTLAMTAGRLVGDAVRARVGSRLLLGGAAAFASVGLAAGLALADPVAAVAGFALLGAGLSCLIPIVFSVTGSISGLPSGAAIAAISTVGYLGFIVGPPLIGGLGELLTLPAALGVVVALTMLVALMARRLPGGSPEAAGDRGPA